jgi:hypothetical protein
MKALVLLFVLFSTVYFAQNTSLLESNHNSSIINQNNEYPKHSIDLRFSMWRNSSSDVSVKFTGVSIDVGGGSTGGRLMYNYYPNEFYAFTFSIGVLSAQINVNAISNYTSSIIPVMMGAKYFLVSDNGDQPFKPYLSGMIGILQGTESGIKILSVNQHSETAMGGYLGVGTDVILGSLVKLHTDLGYNLFSEFEQPIGSKDNYSGPEFSFGVGFMF